MSTEIIQIFLNFDQCELIAHFDIAFIKFMFYTETSKVSLNHVIFGIFLDSSLVNLKFYFYFIEGEVQNLQVLVSILYTSTNLKLLWKVLFIFGSNYG